MRDHAGMRSAIPYRILLVVGALASLAHLPLALPAGRALDLLRNGDVLAFVAFYVAGAFAYLKRPDHPVARWLLVFGVCLTTALALGSALSWAIVLKPGASWLWAGNALEQSVEVAGLAAWVTAFALFPDGVYHRPYERWAVRASFLLVPLIPALLVLTLPTLYLNDDFFWATPSLPNPLFVPALAGLGPVAVAAWWARLVLVLLAAGLLALRYRRLPAEQRLQARWPLLAVLAFGLVGVGPIRLLIELGEAAEVLPPFSGWLAYVSTNGLTALALAVGLLRHRLFDIEVVVRKSLVYGALWLAITLAYVGLATALGIAAGAHVPLGWAILGTIVATLLFQPARRRLERLADRWVFGERLDGYELLARLGALLEQTVAPEDLGPRLAATVRQGLGATWARVAAHRSHGQGEAAKPDPVGADGIGLHEPAAPSLTTALARGDELVGVIECGPKAEGAYTDQDRELLATVGRQAALVLRNTHLAAELARRLAEIQHQAAELAASRMRLVRAEEAGRRRLERDIHDGVQQELVALIAKLRLARNQLQRDLALAERTLGELQADARQALEDLRELARGIHPPLLSDHGLLAAVEARTARLPLRISIEANGVAGVRYAPDRSWTTPCAACWVRAPSWSTGMSLVSGSSATQSQRTCARLRRHVRSSSSWRCGRSR